MSVVPSAVSSNPNASVATLATAVFTVALYVAGKAGWVGDSGVGEDEAAAAVTGLFAAAVLYLGRKKPATG